MIINLTKKRVLSKEEKYSKNFFSQCWGLMFSCRKKNLVMVFKKEKKISLHNWFVFYPLDLLLLDKNKKIIEIKKRFKPFYFWNSQKKGKYLIELGEPCSGSLYEKGDQLFFE